MDIFVTSDLHGYLPQIKPFDFLFICGDICPAHDHYYNFQIEWFQNEFAEWINSLSYKDENSKVIFIGGNHDFVLERIKKNDLAIFYEKTNNRAVYLKNETYKIKGKDENGEEKELTIFGTPYVKIFGRWAFMLPDDKLREKYNKCLENVDIILSHDSPTINNLGLISEGSQKGTDAGNKVLDELIERVHPKYFFSGHIHSGNHILSEYQGTKMVNVSYVDEFYSPLYNDDIFSLKI